MSTTSPGQGAVDALLDAFRERYDVRVPVKRVVQQTDAKGVAKAERRLARGVPGGVAVLVRRDDGALLWLRQDPATGWPADAWVLPGGSVEPGEAFEDAARREVREETGLDVRVERPLLVLDQVIEGDGRGVPGGPFVFFGARPVDADAPPTPRPGEVVEARWWPRAPEGAFDRDHVALALGEWGASGDEGPATIV